MKIGIFFESSPREGGAFHTNLNIVNIFNEYNNDDICQECEGNYEK